MDTAAYPTLGEDFFGSSERERVNFNLHKLPANVSKLPYSGKCLPHHERPYHQSNPLPRLAPRHRLFTDNSGFALCPNSTDSSVQPPQSYYYSMPHHSLRGHTPSHPHRKPARDSIQSSTKPLLNSPQSATNADDQAVPEQPETDDRHPSRITGDMQKSQVRDSTSGGTEAQGKSQAKSSALHQKGPTDLRAALGRPRSSGHSEPDDRAAQISNRTSADDDQHHTTRSGGPQSVPQSPSIELTPRLQGFINYLTGNNLGATETIHLHRILDTFQSSLSQNPEEKLEIKRAAVKRELHIGKDLSVPPQPASSGLWEAHMRLKSGEEAASDLLKWESELTAALDTQSKQFMKQLKQREQQHMIELQKQSSGFVSVVRGMNGQLGQLVTAFERRRAEIEQVHTLAAAKLRSTEDELTKANEDYIRLKRELNSTFREVSSLIRVLSNRRSQSEDIQGSISTPSPDYATGQSIAQCRERNLYNEANSHPAFAVDSMGRHNANPWQGYADQTRKNPRDLTHRGPSRTRQGTSTVAYRSPRTAHDASPAEAAKMRGEEMRGEVNPIEEGFVGGERSLEEDTNGKLRKKGRQESEAKELPSVQSQSQPHPERRKGQSPASINISRDCLNKESENTESEQMSDADVDCLYPSDFEESSDSASNSSDNFITI